MVIFYWILGIALFCLWLVSYICYKMVMMQYVVLSSAGKMQTGNDLGEQVEKTLKEKLPNYFQFYWKVFTHNG